MSPDKKYLYFTLILSLVITVYAAAFIYLGSLLSAILGASGLLGLAVWWLTTFRKTIDTWPILPWYILTVVVLIGNHTEAYATNFTQVITTIFPGAFPEQVLFNDFVFLAVFPLSAVIIYLLGAVGLVIQHPLGDYMAWYTFVFAVIWGSSHFLFLLAGGTIYVPGIGTALLPLAMGIYGIIQLLTGYRAAQEQAGRATLAVR